MRNRFYLAADLVLIWFAALAAFVLRFDLRFEAYRQEFVFFGVAAMVAKPVAFLAAGVYRRYWRYASLPDLVLLLGATTAGSLLVLLALVAGLWTGMLPSFSRSVVVLDGLLTFMLIGGARVASRVISESRRRHEHGDGGRRIVIAGAGAAGVMVARDLERNPQLGIEVVGFLDDDAAKAGKRIGPAYVLGPLAALDRVAAKYGVVEVVIAMPTASGATIRALVEQARALKLASKVIPGVFELVGGQATAKRLREVQIADLLRRNPARPPSRASEHVEGRTVLVTGAGGSIGHEICRQLAVWRPRRLVMLGHGENSLFEARAALAADYPDLHAVTVIADIRDEGRLGRIFREFAPDVVFHAAAHKHVPLLEQNPEEAFTNNAIGTCNVVRAAIAAGTPSLVFISTDKAATPVNLLGASKRLAEEVVRQAAARFGRRFVVVRFGNVLGSRGSAVPIFQQQIARGGPVTVTDPEMKRFFMTIPEAAHLVLEAAAMGRGGELFVLRMGEPVRIVDLATDLIRLSGADDVPIAYTGRRPGEKLEEVLWEDGADIAPTEHPDILAVREPDLGDAIDWVAAAEHLARIAAQGPADVLRAELGRYLPTFVRGAGAPAVPES
ncbi:MAG: polysaccharide biosynthesis protein [Vicinamibacterales bacterium]